MENLSTLDIPTPAYDRATLRTGIVHFGVGGFHRAHQAMYLDELMSSGQALDWAICGVGVLPGDRRMYEVMQAQDHLYTLVIKHPDGRLEPRVIGSIADYLFAPNDPEAVVARMADPGTRIVSLTVTEGGYHVHPVTGALDDRDENIRHDIQDPAAPPRTMFGFVTAALRRRRDAGTGPFTVMSCDNIQGNGDVAQKMITAFARLQDPELAAWIECEVAFPNSMVDRITPVTSDHDRALLSGRFGVADAWPVVCEPFTQWVLEDHFVGAAQGRPAFEVVGVRLVPDVMPYELMKLRLLNAGHQALCYLGYLAGYRYAHEVAQDELFADFLLAYMNREATPTLLPVPGVDLEAYKPNLIERFANPEVRDTLARLCAEASDRIPTFLLPVVRDQLAAGGELTRSALVVAAWARYAMGADEEGRRLEVVDRRRETVLAAAESPDGPAGFLRDTGVFAELADHPRFLQVYREQYEALGRRGAKGAVAALARGAD